MKVSEQGHSSSGMLEIVTAVCLTFGIISNTCIGRYKVPHFTSWMCVCERHQRKTLSKGFNGWWSHRGVLILVAQQIDTE